jgi:AraC-like DNA-binding protein
MPIAINLPETMDTIVTHALPRQCRKMKLPMPETTVMYASGRWGMCLHQQVQIENHVYSEQNIVPQTDMEIHFVSNEPAIVLQIVLSENMQIIYPDGSINQQGRKIGMQYMSPETPYVMQLQAGQKYHCAYIGLSLRLLKELSNAFPMLSALLNTSTSLMLPMERLSSFIRTELDKMKSSLLSGKALIQYARNRISDIVISYLEIIHRKDKVLLYDNKVASLINKVNSNPETNFSVAEQAQILGLTERSLEVAFKQKKGVTLQLYVQQQRIAKAKVLLLSSGRSVADIAFETGYSDPSYFNRVFKQVTGISPGKYRSNGQS